jgi:hypothetical protein
MIEFLPVGAPALPLDEAGKYVAAAYIVFVVLILVYVAIMAAKLQRIQRDLGSLAELAERPSPGGAERDVGQIHDREQEIQAVRQGDRG